ncbi:MAG: N-acetylmuramoyl-L-alanine amidase [Desulfobacterales bacterium]|nr:MAG: N-acetylmuramoyl-L-alanine amidase [Desulfobacterales bacterium]
MMNKESLYAFFLCSLLLILCHSRSPASDQQQVQLQLSGVKRVAIDPGFGGKNFGAPGYIKGVHSKDVNLEIARKLAQKIHEKLHLDVIMTRESC